MNLFEYFIMEEFIFPEEGGVTGTRPIDPVTAARRRVEESCARA